MATGEAKIIDNAIMGLHATATPPRWSAWPNPADIVPSLRAAPMALGRSAADEDISVCNHPVMEMTLRVEIFPDDLDETVDFYTNVLGFAVTKDERAEQSAYVVAGTGQCAYRSCSFRLRWGDVRGAWLLVSGPSYHGSVELDELDVDREGIEGIKASAVRTAQGRPSAWWWWWWWLLPPVMYVLHRRWTTAFRQATLAQLTQTQSATAHPARLGYH